MSNPSERERSLIWRAGIFVGAGLLLSGLVIFLLGKERGLFGDQIPYHTAFASVDGLQINSPVRLGGMSVGRVKKIEFSDNLHDSRIRIEFEVQKAYADRIREDSVVRIVSRGVLGDKAMDVSIGSPDKPMAKRNAFLEAGASGDVTALLNRAGEIIDNVVDITRGVKGGVDVYADPTLAKNLAGVLDSLNAVLSGIQSGPGVLHTLIFDKQLGEDTKTVLRELSSSVVKLDAALKNVDALVSEVRKGEGLVGALLNDKKTVLAFQSLGDAASELASLLKVSRENSDGAIHRLVYGDSAPLIDSLAASAADLRAIMGKVRSGEGSLGAIVNDPSVYEDLKEILGNIKRNRLLRGLVRLSISHGEDFEQLGEATPSKN
ncbi:MAG: MlaD family protein [Cystobacterineae bacterium]|nr:MlaD family protein [Cystobacterineae bacterium]